MAALAFIPRLRGRPKHRISVVWVSWCGQSGGCCHGFGCDEDEEEKHHHAHSISVSVTTAAEFANQKSIHASAEGAIRIRLISIVASGFQLFGW